VGGLSPLRSRRDAHCVGIECRAFSVRVSTRMPFVVGWPLPAAFASRHPLRGYRVQGLFSALRGGHSSWRSRRDTHCVGIQCRAFSVRVSTRMTISALGGGHSPRRSRPDTHCVGIECRAFSVRVSQRTTFSALWGGHFGVAWRARRDTLCGSQLGCVARTVSATDTLHGMGSSFVVSVSPRLTPCTVSSFVFLLQRMLAR
jgi:hypothetical protein